MAFIYYNLVFKTTHHIIYFGIFILQINFGLQANIIRIFKQLEFFQVYQTRVTALIGAEETQRLVNGALVLITLGGNDFVNNYFYTPVTARRLQYSLQDFSRYLISEYKKILTVITFLSLLFL